MPPSACSKRPRRSSAAPVNAPFSWPNSSDSSRSAVNRRGVERDEGLGGARAVTVQGARDELLAGARLAGDQHRHARARQPADGAEHLLHRGRVAEHLRDASRLGGRGRRSAAPAPRRAARVPRPGRCRRAWAGTRRRRPGRRRPRCSRSECAVMTITGRPRPLGADFLEQLEAAASRHADVGHQHVGRVAGAARRARTSACSKAVDSMPACLSARSSTQRIEASSSTSQTSSGFAELMVLEREQEGEYGPSGTAVELDQAVVAADRGPARRRARDRCRPGAR